MQGWWSLFWCTKRLCSPLCGISFGAFHGPFAVLRKTDIKSHSMTCKAGRIGEGVSGWSRWRRVFCGNLHTGTVLLCRWLNRFAYLSCVVLRSHCIIVQRVKGFIVMDRLLRHFGLLWAATWNRCRQHQLLDYAFREDTWQTDEHIFRHSSTWPYYWAPDSLQLKVLPTASLCQLLCSH